MRKKKGQGLVEYALTFGLVAVVAIAALHATGTNIDGMFVRLNTPLAAVAAGQSPVPGESPAPDPTPGDEEEDDGPIPVPE